MPVLPSSHEGSDAPKGAGVAFHAGRFGCCDSLHTRARLSARHRGVFGRRDRASGYWEGLNFDLIITLSPEAHHKALELTRTNAADVEYWPTHDPSNTEGNRDQKLSAYREVMDSLLLRIRKRFAKGGAASG